jgi:hypothetical protein
MSIQQAVFFQISEIQYPDSLTFLNYDIRFFKGTQCPDHRFVGSSGYACYIFT